MQRCETFLQAMRIIERFDVTSAFRFLLLLLFTSTIVSTSITTSVTFSARLKLLEQPLEQSITSGTLLS